MGGNAFEQAQRIPAAIYDNAVEVLVSWAHKNKIDLRIPFSYGGKETHGDIDILFNKKDVDRLQEFIDYLSPVATIKHQQGFNLLIDVAGALKIQVDITLAPEDEIDFSFWYFSFNDLGNLIGRIAHRQGLKFGHDGLWYIYRDGSQVLDKILLTDDIYEALEYLGFESDQFLSAGFLSKEDMFAWVERSRYFDPMAFPLEHRNHRARVRDSKRKIYNEFLRWLAERYDLTHYEPADKVAYLQAHKAYWSHLAPRMEQADERLRRKKLYKAAVGGDIVMELTGLQGKKLGEFMRVVKERFPETSSVHLLPQKFLDSEIIRLYTIWKGQGNSHE